MKNKDGKMICIECGSPMYVDDKDLRFKGNYDLYWNCEKCQTSCIEEIRFNRPFKECWHSENDGVKDRVFRIWNWIVEERENKMKNKCIYVTIKKGTERFTLDFPLLEILGEIKLL